MYSLFGTLAAAAMVMGGHAHPTKSSSSQKTVSVPASWEEYGYLFNISIGTPPQNLTMLSDWTWVALFARSGRCTQAYNPSLCVASGQQYFDERASTSFANTSLPELSWPVTAFADDFTVDYGADVVRIGALAMPNVTFQVSDFPFAGAAVPVEPFGGIYGLAPVTAGLNQTFYPTSYQAWKSGETGPQVGWHSCANLTSKETCLGGDAKFVFGGSDETLYDADDLQWYPIVDPTWLGEAFYPYSPPKSNYWSTAWTGGWLVAPNGTTSANYAVKVSTGSVKRGVRAGEAAAAAAAAKKHKKRPTSVAPIAVLDEGSEGLGVPLSARAYADLVAYAGATLADNDTVTAIAAQGSSSPTAATAQDWYLVDCDAAERLPSVVYELDGRANYTLAPTDYVQELEGTGRCYLNVNLWRYSETVSGDATVIPLGVAFLKKLYVILDFEKLAFGLAPLSNWK